MKKKIIFVLICFITLAIGVKAETISELTDGQTLEIKNAVKPTDRKDLSIFVKNYLQTNGVEVSAFTGVECDESYTNCTITLNETPTNVTIVWGEGDKEVLKMIEQQKEIWNKRYHTLKDAPNSGYSVYQLSLQDLINIKGKIGTDSILKSTQFNNDKIDSKFEYVDTLLSYPNVVLEGYDDFSRIISTVLIEYNGMYYGSNTFAIYPTTEPIYVPSDTEETLQSMIDAATKVVNNLTGKNDVKLTASSICKDTYSENCNFNLSIGEDAIGSFKIVKDSAKLSGDSHIFNDYKTGLKIKTDSSEVPYDTEVKVSVLDKESETYKKLIDTLKVTNAFSYDISLFSKSLNNFITTINGEFIVSIPVPEELKGKDLVVYYVNDTIKETYGVTVENDIATFKTNHFSTYTLAEKTNEVDTEDTNNLENSENLPNVPKTYDSIINYLILSSIGVIGIISSILVLRKKEN